MFPYLMKQSEMMSNFNAFMAGSLKIRPDWFNTFPEHDILFNDANADDPEAVLLIDIGGGEGHDVAAFQKGFPDAPGKLVLQDLLPVIENIKSLDAAIIRQKHDFFTQQPVKGARGYYVRNIFHAWPDHSCVEIMKQHRRRHGA